MTFQILFEDKDILVCIKPEKTAVQNSKSSIPDMVSLIKNYLHQKSPKSGEPYLAVIHRLDQPVTGILVFAKTPAAAKELNRQLQNGGFGKYYLALLTSQPEASEATLTDYMIKDGRTNTSRICAPGTAQAKKAVLHYKMIPRTKEFTFLSAFPPELPLAAIQLDTGRHHQIRLQMSHMGCPIAGDQKYGAIPTGRPASEYKTLALWAYRLTFTHPYTKKKMDFHLN